MSNVEICRVCLCRGVRMYGFSEYSLKQYYEEINDIEIHENDDKLPQHFCYMCATLLYKFHKFKQKCQNGQQILCRLLYKGSITPIKLEQIDRESKNLKTPLNIITVNNRVKTFTLKDQFLDPMEIEDEVNDEEAEELEIEFVEDDKWSNFDSVHSSDCEENDRKIKDDNNIKHVVIVDENKDDKDANKFDCPNFDSDTSNCSKQMITRSAQAKKNVSNDFIMKHFGEYIFPQENKASEVKEPEINNTEVKKKRKYTPRRPNWEKPKETKPRSSYKKKNARTEAERKRAKEMYGGQQSTLDSKHWLYIVFNEDEAREKFREKANNPKYLAANYACDKCYRPFTKQDMMIRHMKLRHCESIGPFECDFCMRRFKSRGPLAKHTREHYDFYKCLRCDYTGILEASAKNHDIFHNGFYKECKPCQQEFRHPSTYYTHVRVHHRSEHVCTLCGASFVSHAGLLQHKTLRHVDDHPEPESDETSTYCERCDIKFLTEQAYQDHFRESINHAEERLPGETVNKDESSGIIPPRKVLSNDVMKHRKAPRQTTCNVCGQLFSTYIAYKAHHQAEHPKAPLILKTTPKASAMCDICGSMIKLANMEIHYNIHTRAKLYPCNICGMQFNNQGNMHTHKITHTGEKPHKCPLCDKRFTQKSSMKLHHRTFHLKEPYPRKKKKVPIPIPLSDVIF